MLVNVVINSGPREDSTRIERAGTVRRRASLNQVSKFEVFYWKYLYIRHIYIIIWIEYFILHLHTIKKKLYGSTL